MPPEIIPSNEPPRVPVVNEDEKHRGKGRITCECCGSTLDRSGNLLRRGDLARQYLDAEDTIENLKKQLKKSADDLATTRDELTAARAAVQTTKPRSRFSLGADA